MKKLVWLLLAGAVVVYWLAGRPSGSHTNEAIDWRREPVQTPTERKPFERATRHGTLSIVPRAAYDVAAVVRGAERYRFDDLAFLAPVDVVLTWGELPTPKYESIDYSQSWRFFFWRTKDLALDRDYVVSHAANTHLIPADENVRKAILTIGRGDAVRLRGLLVDVEGESGFHWTTSLVRTDSGDGGCEILWVESADIGGTLFE